MKFCAYCGAKLEDDALFCHICGEKCIEFFDENEPEPTEEEIALAKKQEEERLAEEKRLEEERKAKEEAERLEKERLEQARLEEEARLAEEARIAEEARLAEERRLEEERKAQEEAARVAEENAKKAEIDRLVEARLVEERERIREEERAKLAPNQDVRPVQQAYIEVPIEEETPEIKKGGFIIPAIMAILAVICGAIFLILNKQGLNFAFTFTVAGVAIAFVAIIFSIITLASKKRSGAAKLICLSILLVSFGIIAYLFILIP